VDKAEAEPSVFVLKVKIITSNGDIGFPVQVFWFYYSKALFKYLSFQYFDNERTG
jgi:hypothetical protein